MEFFDTVMDPLGVCGGGDHPSKSHVGVMGMTIGRNGII